MGSGEVLLHLWYNTNYIYKFELNKFKYNYLQTIITFERCFLLPLPLLAPGLLAPTVLSPSLHLSLSLQMTSDLTPPPPLPQGTSSPPAADFMWAVYPGT